MSEDKSSDIYQKLILLLIRSKRHLAKLCEKRDMTPVQGMLILMLESEKTKSMNELSCNMGCDASNITGLVDRLASANLIKRTVDPNDRRVKMVQLSNNGKKLREELLLGLKEAEALDMQKLTEEEHAQLERIVDKLTAK
jgi:DNA-binding MarR family transcriptional regulator